MQIIADSAIGLIFKNKRDRKVINVDPKVRERERGRGTSTCKPEERKRKRVRNWRAKNREQILSHRNVLL